MAAPRKKKDEQPEEVQQKTGVTALVVSVQGLDIVANFDELAAEVARIADEFRGMEVTPQTVQEAKRYRAYLNSVAKSIDAERLRVKREFTAPVTAFEGKVKELIAPVREVSEELDKQVKAFEEQVKEQKRADIEAHWNEFAGILADVVKFETVFDPKWLNASESIGNAFVELEDTVRKIASDEAMLSELNLSHPDEAKATYFATLDMAAAIARSKALDEQEERTRKFEAEKAELLAARAAEEEAQEPEPEPTHEPEPVMHAVTSSGEFMPAAPKRERWVLTFEDATREQVSQVAAYAKTLGLTGKARTDRNEREG